MPRRVDTLKIQAIGGGRTRGEMKNFTSFRLALDMMQPSEANFELGDDGTWNDLGDDYFQPATRYRVYVNDLLQLTGRVEANDVPLDAAAGSVVRFTVRTVLADANATSANPGIRVRNSNLLDFILALYAPLGVTESDFHFDRPSLLRDLRTGASTKNSGRDFKIRLNKLKLDEMRVRPPESIFQAADRHLRRFGLMHWDGPDGKIVIGFPNQSQKASYTFAAFRDARARANNTLGTTRSQDWSQVPSSVYVAGRGGKRAFSKAPVVGIAVDSDVAGSDSMSHRPVYILAEGIRNEEAARNAAERELTARVKAKDVVNHEVDGFSFYDGRGQYTYANDTVATYVSDAIGGNNGSYYVHRVEMERDASRGDITRLTMLKAGLWRLYPDAYEGKLR